MWRLYAALVLAFSSCKTDQDTHKIESAQVEQLVIKTGQKIASDAQQALGGQLKKAISEKGPAYAVDFCNSAAYPILESVSTDFSVSIKRPSLRTRNPNDAPSPTEREILISYQEDIEKDRELTPVVKPLGDDQLMYAQPILINTPLCLNCHGEKGTQVAEATLAVIKKHYPTDNALNHKLGDLRGMWSITFNRKELEAYLTEENHEKDMVGQHSMVGNHVSIETSCYICHNPNSTSHDNILAPPLAGIKRHYLRVSDGRSDFINRMTNYIMNPNEEDALMKGPIKRFGVMPKTALNENEVREIVTYIHDNEIPAPEWFEDHHKNRGRKH